MSGKPKPKSTEPKRFNRVAGLSEALGAGLDPVFRKRGFATRDIIAQWQAIVPPPYCDETLPDKLVWPRAAAGAEGAVLHVRCAEAHRMALEHEAPQIAAAINRYFGYVLVDRVRLSALPFSKGSHAPAQTVLTPDPEAARSVEDAVTGVEDEGVREALRQWGLGIASTRNRQ